MLVSLLGLPNGLHTSTWCLQVFEICSNACMLYVLIQCSSGLAPRHPHHRCYWLSKLLRCLQTISCQCLTLVFLHVATPTCNCHSPQKGTGFVRLLVATLHCTCRDDSKTRWQLHSVGPTSTGLSLLGQNIIHSPVARVVYGWWALAYKLTRMPGLTENVPHCAIWHHRGSLDENACFSLLSHTFRLIWLYRHSLQ